MSRPLPNIDRGNRGKVRNDLEPLTRRFPALGTPLGATWQSGVLGDSRVPGPSTYWIEAVVKVTPETAAALQRDTGVAPTNPPVVPHDLAPALTDGPWFAGDALDRAFATSGFAGRAFLDVENTTLVLLVVGGNP